ncbi:hypothetical protein GCM10009634_31290 [Saccharothrix xinjiangensis]
MSVAADELVPADEPASAGTPGDLITRPRPTLGRRRAVPVALRGWAVGDGRMGLVSGGVVPVSGGVESVVSGVVSGGVGFGTGQERVPVVPLVPLFWFAEFVPVFDRC